MDAFHHGIIEKDLYEAILVKHPKTPTFYFLPKTHTNILCPPVRPIISGNGAHTKLASQLVDKYLSPHVVSLASYVQDAPDLRRLENIHVPKDTVLLAIDIEAL